MSRRSSYSISEEGPLLLCFGSCRCEESLEQRPEFAGPPEVLRVPLHAEAEPCRRVFDRLDDAVGGGGGHSESAGDVFHRLVMPTVHLNRVAAAQALAHQVREQRSLVQPDLV